jgi:hypothetical protein
LRGLTANFSDRGNPAYNGISTPPRGLSRLRRLLIRKQCQLALSGTSESAALAGLLSRFEMEYGGQSWPKMTPDGKPIFTAARRMGAWHVGVPCVTAKSLTFCTVRKLRTRWFEVLAFHNERGGRAILDRSSVGHDFGRQRRNPTGSRPHRYPASRRGIPMHSSRKPAVPFSLLLAAEIATGHPARSVGPR